ncbi:hypothetical protein BDV29DRAFT_182996 [Aspergillus leporis]|uniref:Uncharacterized protein n=1 Tax=Aspergillus leporis TaxID=41062 RepID=A0A5N5WQ23_9EURO|nr:hypothetical protein BDV29DRAFT_182996 [Aspergillus leporis]
MVDDIQSVLFTIGQMIVSGVIAVGAPTCRNSYCRSVVRRDVLASDDVVSSVRAGVAHSSHSVPSVRTRLATSSESNFDPVVLGHAGAMDRQCERGMLGVLSYFWTHSPEKAGNSLVCLTLRAV